MNIKYSGKGNVDCGSVCADTTVLIEHTAACHHGELAKL